MMRPSYRLTIGSEEFSMENGSDLISIRVVRSIGLPTDDCEIFLVEKEDYPFKRDDEVKVQLGYDEKLFPVFSGFVDNIEHGIATVRLSALGLAVGLIRLRIERVYLNQTAGGIMGDLAKEANVKVGEASDGISLPIYVVDYSSNAYEHILKLADRCNFDAYVTDDEQLMFKEWDGGRSHSLEYGKEIIRVERLNFSPPFVSTRVYGESPSSVKGSDTFHWFTKQEVKGEAGGGVALSILDSAIKDTVTANTVADAKLKRLKHTLAIAVETVGKPEVKLGDTLILEGMPASIIQGKMEVRSVEHYLSKAKGFTTRINCWMMGE